MAAKLQNENPNVVHLKPRKAKGAGGQKRKGPSTNRTKPRAGESKPPAPRVAAQPSDADVRRNLQDRLIALHTQHRAMENRKAVADEALGEIRGELKLVRAAIQNAGFPLALYDDANAKLKLKTKKTDLEAQERMRGLIFEAFGLPVGPQPELALEGVPEAARPALHWEAFGYQQGIDGFFSDPQRDNVPPENLQEYMRGFEQAAQRNASGLKSLKADPPKTADAAPPLMVGEDPERAALKQHAGAARVAAEEARQHIAAGKVPTWDGYPVDPDLWTDEQKDVFCNWYDGLDPDGPDIDIQHAGAVAMFDRLDEAQQPATDTAAASEPQFED